MEDLGVDVTGDVMAVALDTEERDKKDKSKPECDTSGSHALDYLSSGT